MHANMKRLALQVSLASMTALAVPAVVTGQASTDEVDLRLVTALEQQDTHAVRTLLAEGVDANARRADGATPLLFAAHWDDLDVADLLLNAGADVNTAEDHGVTPLALACENASVPMVEKLLAAGATAGATQSNGVTPLMTAARTGNVAVAEALLAHGASVNSATTTIQQTALMWAVAEGHADMVRVLIAADADVQARSARGFTPLLFAARNGDVEIARVLLTSGAGVDELGSDGTHALPLAIVSGQDEFATFLLEEGADPNGMLHGVSALHAAAGPVDMWLREWLRVRGIDGVFGSPVMRLDPARQLAIVQALLDGGADPNARITTSTVAVGYLTPKRGAFEHYSIGTGDLRGATPLWVAAFAANRARYDPESPRPGTGPAIVQALVVGGRRPYPHDRRRHHTADGGSRTRSCVLQSRRHPRPPVSLCGSHRQTAR